MEKISFGKLILALKGIADAIREISLRRGIAAKMNISTAWALATATLTYIPFNNTLFSRGNIACDIPNQRININEDGIYLVTVSALFADSTGGTARYGYLYRNGVTIDYAAGFAMTKDGAGRARMSFTTTVACVAGDNIKASLYQDTGGALNVTYATLSVSKIAD